MSVRWLLTMRAKVDRMADTGAVNAYNEAVIAPAEVASAMPCLIRHIRSTVLHENKFVALSNYRLYTSKDVDLLAEDKISDIRDRKGDSVFDGNYRVLGEPLHRVTYTEAQLERY